MQSSKTFETYQESLVYYDKNKDNVPEGFVMGISLCGRKVNVSPIFAGHENYNSPDVNKENHIHIISDTIDGVLNPADGKRYDSKSKYYQAVKDSGSHIVEKGENYTKPELTNSSDYKKELAKDVVSTISQLRQRG
jgi:hypothetical protein